MANPTSNFGWQMPTNTDLVKDLPADFEVFGQAVDTSMADLKGGTTGQILSKNSNTDMDFVWITNDVGDITAVSAGTGLSGGGTSGAVTLSIDTATTVDKTTAQTLTNKTLTSPIISSISNTGTLTLPTSTDTLVGRATTDTLTNKTISATSNTISGVINNTLTTTTGDLIYASSANTPARLAIGSTNQVLTVSGGVPTWAAAGGGGWTSLGTATLSSTVTTISFTATGYRNIVLQVYDPLAASGGGFIVKPNNTGSICTFSLNGNYNGGTYATALTVNGDIYHGYVNQNTSGTNKSFIYLVFNNPASTTYAKTFTGLFSSNSYNTNLPGVYCFDGYVNTTSALSSFGFSNQGGNFISGDVTVYGVK